jgi:hypothetical protein
LNARSALLGFFVALTIVLASTTVIESGIRTTMTSTSTLTNTLTQTVTATSTTTRLMTSVPFSSVFLGNTALVLNSSDGLGLSLQVGLGLNGNYTITVRESNLMDSVNNVSEADEWTYPQDSLTPCGPDSYTVPVQLAVVQGRYGQDNYTSAKALSLYNTGDLYPCGEVVSLAPTAFSFQPMNDSFSITGWNPPYFGAASASISTSGYWTGGYSDVPAAFKPFSPGVYTIIGADEWGDAVLLQAFLE